jgi:TP901 family phage tail tape measure protein
MPDFTEAKTKFTARDGITKSFRDMDKGATRFGRNATKSFRDASRSAGRFRDVTKGILAAGFVQRGIGLLTQGIGALTRQFIDFDQATIGATSRFKDIGPEAANFEEALSQVRDRAREAGATTEFTAAQAAVSLDFLARAGWDSVEAFAGLDSMIALATATGEDFARVADISSDLMGSFGLNTDDTAQKIKNLNRLNDVLVKTVNSTNVNMENLFDTMTQVGQISAGVLGASLEDVASLTGALGNAGIKGSNAMTALKNAYLRLAAPVGEGADLLKFLNVTLDDGSGGARRMTDVMEELGQKINKLSVTKQAAALNLIFGKRAIAGGKNIIDNIASINKLRVSLENAGGTAQATATRMRQSLGNRLKALGSAASELGFKIIEAFEVRGEGAIDRMTEAIRNFDSTPIIQFAEVMVSAFKLIWNVVGPVLSGIKRFIEFTAQIAAVAFDSVLDLISGIEKIAVKAAIIFDRLPEIMQSIDTGFGNILNPLLSGVVKAFEFIGLEGPGEREPERTAPNEEEAAARREIDFNGQINITGAPPGSTAEGETRGAPDIDMALLGTR